MVDAFEQFYREWYPEIYRFVFRMLMHEDMAMEAVQKIFIKVYRHWSKVDQVNNKKAWLFRIAYTTIQDMFRSNQRHHKFQSIQEVPELTFADNRDGLFQHISRTQLQQIFFSVFQLLPAEQRMVIILKLYHDMTFEEMAILPGIHYRVAISTTLGAGKYFGPPFTISSRFF